MSVRRRSRSWRSNTNSVRASRWRHSEQRYGRDSEAIGKHKNESTNRKEESTFSSVELIERAIQRRAVEAVIWGMPAVNTDLMYQAMARETKGGWNQIVYWSRLLDWKNQTLTPTQMPSTSCPSITRRRPGQCR